MVPHRGAVLLRVPRGPGPTYVTTPGAPDLVDRLIATGTSWPAWTRSTACGTSFRTHHVEMFERTDEVLSRMAHDLGTTTWCAV